MGDVDNSTVINIVDALLLATYQVDNENSIVLENLNYILERGDVNESSTIDIVDALICATYSVYPDNPFIPLMMGQPIGNSLKAAVSELQHQKVITGDARLSVHENKQGQIIFTPLFDLHRENIKIGAVSAFISWDPDSLHFIGGDTSSEYYFINDKNSSRGELSVSMFSLTGTNSLALPKLIFEKHFEYDVSKVTMDITTASTAEHFLPIIFSNEHKINIEDTGDGPESIILYNNLPNPFNGTTIIRFKIGTSENVSLKVYNINGQIVNRLVNSKLPSGLHTIFWDGTDNAGNTLASGVYLYQLIAGNKSMKKQLLLLR